MIDFVVAYWNDVITVAAFLIAAFSGYYQIQHYRAEKADINILDVYEAKYSEIKGQTNSDGGLSNSETPYELKVRVENDGREPTTISGATLLLDTSGEEFRLDRYEGSTMSGIGDGSSLKRLQEVGSEVRVAGNDVVKLQYRATGVPRDDHSEEVEGRFRLRTVSGNSCEAAVSFSPREH